MVGAACMEKVVIDLFWFVIRYSFWNERVFSFALPSLTGSWFFASFNHWRIYICIYIQVCVCMCTST